VTTIDVAVPTPDGSSPSSLHVPDGDGPWPGAILYPDAGSTREVFRQMGERLAAAGYVVLVPDVYYRAGAYEPFSIATAFTDPDERKRLGQMAGALTVERIVADAAAYVAFLHTRPEVGDGPVGTTGYCMGGRTSFTVAGRLPERVAVAMSFHGGGLVTEAPDSPHLAAPRIQAVVYVAAAESDASFTAENGVTLDGALADAGVEHTVEFYPAAHGFAVPDNAGAYDKTADERHWQAMERVFGAAL